MIENAALWSLSQGDIREPSYQVSMAFDKVYDPNISFARYDDGFLYDDSNLYAYTESDVLQQWDQYAYTDYSDRVLDVNWKRQESRPSNVSLCQCDVVFDNIDDFFTPENETSPLYPHVSPGRPIRVQSGFSGNIVRSFVGLSQGMPRLDEKAKTATFHCIDFLTLLLDMDLSETVMLEDYRVDEILEYIFDLYGLTPNQYVLETGSFDIPFFYAEKDLKLKGIIDDLVTSELGSLTMDETGMIRFTSQDTLIDDVVAEFSTLDNILDGGRRREADLINSVKLKSQVRDVKINQLIFQSTEVFVVPAGESIDVWADFIDPVTQVYDPVYGLTGSFFVVNTVQDGSGADSTDVVLSSSDTFGMAWKGIFSNPTTSPLYITSLVLYGDPAILQDPIFFEAKLDSSVDRFDEALFEYESKYIGSRGNLQTLAGMLLAQYGNYAGLFRLVVRGSPQLQIGDVISVDWYGRTSLCRIVQIENGVSKDGFTQTLYVKDQPTNPFGLYDDDLLYDDNNVYGF